MSAANNKVPYSYRMKVRTRTGKKNLEIWCKLTDLVGKRTLAINLVLTGKARIALSGLEVTELKAEERVKTLLNK